MNTYTITHTNGLVDTVKGIKLEYSKETGQIIIFSVDRCGLYELVAVVPSTSFVKILTLETTGAQ